MANTTACIWFLARTNSLNSSKMRVKNGVFHQQTLDRLKMILERRDPFLEVIGIGADGTLSQDIDEELYGENPA